MELTESKKKEIALIEKLIALNGYFADLVRDDLDIIKKNIENDFAFESGTHFDVEAEKNKIRRSWKNDVEQIADIYIHMVTHQSSGSDVDDDIKDLESYLIARYGRKNLIRRKYANDIPLSKSDMAFLLQDDAQ